MSEPEHYANAERVGESTRAPWGGENVCRCVTRHRPRPKTVQWHHTVPKYLGGPDTPQNLVAVCATTHDNVHHWIRVFEKYGGKPPAEALLGITPYERSLLGPVVAKMGWAWPNTETAA